MSENELAQPELLIGQAGDSYVRISAEGEVVFMLPYEDLKGDRMTCDRVGRLRRKGMPSGLSAISSLNGWLKLSEPKRSLWEVQVDHELFSVYSMDVTGDGSDEIVACAWDGMTYIVDQQQNMAKFQLEESVVSFCAGMYSFTSGHPSPSLVYVNTMNEIVIYHSIEIPSIATDTLVSLMQTELGEFYSFKGDQGSLGSFGHPFSPQLGLVQRLSLCIDHV